MSVKLLDSDLVAAGGAHAKPLSVWVADGEAELEAAWRLGVESVITNRPRWASGVMAKGTYGWTLPFSSGLLSDIAVRSIGRFWP